MKPEDIKQIEQQTAKVREAYEEAERNMLEKVKARLARGITEPGWQERKLAEIRALTDSLFPDLKNLREVNAQVDDMINNAYDAGVQQAVGEMQDAGLTYPATANWNRGNAVKAVINESRNGLDKVGIKILRSAQDAYRECASLGVTQVVLGSRTLKEAVQDTLNRFADNGISGFTDSAGRKWTAQSYAEMCIRTGTLNAYRQGHIDKLVNSGYDLIITSRHSPTCEFCYPWQNRVLKLRGDSEYPSLAEAKAEKFLHPNCGHSFALYIPGVTEIPEPLSKKKLEEDMARNKEEYGAIQKQRQLERNVRRWKRREAVAIDPEEKAKCKIRIKNGQKALREHIKTTNEAYTAKYGQDEYGNDYILLNRDYGKEANRAGEAGVVQKPVPPAPKAPEPKAPKVKTEKPPTVQKAKSAGTGEQIPKKETLSQRLLGK